MRAPRARVGIFEVVLTDVGDDQNLTKNLSTFSAHVRNLARILDDTQPGALVLLDELAGGTDPREGEALAAGMLDSLTARGGAVVVTTHYEGLKALALADDRFENASMGFDLARDEPDVPPRAGRAGQLERARGRAEVRPARARSSSAPRGSSRARTSSSRAS